MEVHESWDNWEWRISVKRNTSTTNGIGSQIDQESILDGIESFIAFMTTYDKQALSMNKLSVKWENHCLAPNMKNSFRIFGYLIETFQLYIPMSQCHDTNNAQCRCSFCKSFASIGVCMERFPCYKTWKSIHRNKISPTKTKTISNSRRRKNSSPMRTQCHWRHTFDYEQHQSFCFKLRHRSKLST